MEMGLGDHCPRGILDTKDSMRRKPFYGVTNLRPPNLQILKPVGGAHEPKRVSKLLKFNISWHSYVGKIPKDATNLVGSPLPTKTQTIKCYEHRSGNQLPGSTDPAKNTELVLINVRDICKCSRGPASVRGSPRSFPGFRSRASVSVRVRLGSFLSVR